jgi:hypothetical protein
MGMVPSSDDAGPPPPSLPPCDCTGLALQPVLLLPPNQCPLSSMCVAQNCCYENTQNLPFLTLHCTATPTVCMPSPTPQ